MTLRAKMTWYAALLLVAGAVTAAEQGPGRKEDKKQAEQKAGALPPLIVDTDSPLLLDEGRKPAPDDGPVAPSVAENAACYVCHANYQEEELVKIHAAGDTGCVDCHGKSYAHRNDENNTTPPDVMFPRERIEDACGKCHESHDVPAADVIARLQDRVPPATAAQQVVCTDCHGRHRLAHRTVLWDKATGKLQTDRLDAVAQKAAPTLGVIKALVGTWVLEDEHGQPTDQVVSTYRITAAGNAVVEVMFEDTDREVVTVYHQDDADLFLTRYGPAGSPARMQCRAGSDLSQLVFQRVDASSLGSGPDTRPDALTLTIVDSNHIRAKWQGCTNGKPGDLQTLNLVRQ